MVSASSPRFAARKMVSSKSLPCQKHHSAASSDSTTHPEPLIAASSFSIDPRPPPTLRTTRLGLSTSISDERFTHAQGSKAGSSRLRRINAEFGSVLAQELRNHHLAAYRDRRLSEVGPQTVKHEINLLRRILKLGSDEWGITLPHGVPSIRMPRLPRDRERRVSEEELLLIKSQLTPTMAAIVTLALETAMRRSEIIRLQPQDLLPGDRIYVRDSKNGRSRVIPVTPDAQRALSVLLGGPRPSADSVSQAFRRACKGLCAEDLHFHDLRHEAISRFFERGFSVPQVATISGHEDFRMLARYTHIASSHTQLGPRRDCRKSQ